MRQIILLVILLVLALLFVQAQIVWAAYLVVFLIIAELAGNIFAGIFSFFGSLWRGLGDTIAAEGKEMEAAKPKGPSGKAFAEDVLSSSSKAVASGEKAKHEKKKIEPKTGLFNVLNELAGSTLDKITKLFK